MGSCACVKVLKAEAAGYRVNDLIRLNLECRDEIIRILRIVQKRFNNRIRRLSFNLHCAQNRRPDRANPMIAGAAPANLSWIQVTGCDDQKSGFALFRHERRA